MATPADVRPSGQRDLFLSYNSVDREIVSRWEHAVSSRGISTFYDRADLTPGQPWFDQLEAALCSVRGGAVFVGTEGLGRLQKREVHFLMARQAEEEKAGRQFPVIPVLLAGVDPEMVPGFLALNTWIDLRRGPEDANALDSFERAFQHKILSPTGHSQTLLCPYRGLNAFREDDTQLFFGRQDLSRHLFEFVQKKHFVTVVGGSGSGKSSVAQAGLLPLLRAQKPPAETWESIVFTPASKPFHRLAVQLVPFWRPPGSDQTDIGTESEKLGNRLANGEVTLSIFIRLALNHLPDTSRLVLIVDQFEELFTQTPDEERKRFIGQLLAASRESSVTIVIILRADFYGAALSLGAELSALIAAGIVNVVEMNRNEIQQAIEQPAERCGVSFEKGLIDRILDHVERQPGRLPLLEYALTELWQRREGRVLTHASYDAIGGVEGAISKRAEHQFDKLSVGQQAVAMSAMCRLVRVSSANAEGADARQIVRLADLDPDARAVMRIFAAREARLVVLGRDDSAGGEIVQVAHEALIRGWDKLKSWVDGDREFLIWRQQLRPFLEKWESLERDKEGALLQGIYLAEARRWLRERPGDLNPQEQQFIQASTKSAVRPIPWKRWSLAIASLFLLLVVLAADAGVSFPGSLRLRRWIDKANSSIFRRPKTYLQIETMTNDRAFDTVERLITHKDNNGWIGSALPETVTRPPAVDYTSHAQATCALLHAPSTTNIGAISPADELRMIFATDLTQRPKQYGWFPDTFATQPTASPLLWTGSALAGLYARHLASSEPWSGPEFLASLRYVQQSSVLYHDNAASGWRLLTASGPSVYATTLATQMLMDMRDAGVPWPGDENITLLIRRNVEWLLTKHQTDQTGFAGWTEGNYPFTVPGLTLQIYAVLLRAQIHHDRSIPRNILNAVTALVEGGFDDDEFHDVDVWPQDLGRSLTLLWHPWAIECVARWLELHADDKAVVNNHLVRGTLTHLLANVDGLYPRNEVQTYKYSELLYSLGSLSNIVAAINRRGTSPQETSN